MFLHNTKITTSKRNEDRALSMKRDSKHARGRAISEMEMRQMILQYPEVHTNLVFESIPTMPLELRAGVEKFKFKSQTEDENGNRGNQYDIFRGYDGDGNVVEDGAHVGVEIDLVRTLLTLNQDRQIRDTELLILKGTKKATLSVDKITKFSIRPPELRYIVDMVGNYYRWFKVGKGSLKYDEMHSLLDNDLRRSSWIDGLGHIVKLRYNALPEVVDHCKYLLDEEFYMLSDTTVEMAEMLIHLNEIYETIDKNEGEELETILDETDATFFIFAQVSLIAPKENDSSNNNLPVPIYTFTKPSMGHQFILHILLSMGRFETEVDLTLHESLRASLRYAKLIGPENDEESLKQYSKDLLQKYVVEQCVQFPNSMRQLATFIVDAGNLFDDIIIRDFLPITDLPSVLQSAIFESHERAQVKYWKNMRTSLTSAAIAELGEQAIENCNIPETNDIINATCDSPLDWNISEEFRRGENQSIESFNEQLFALKMIQDFIDSFNNYTKYGSRFVSCVGVVGIPGGGKSFFGQMTCLYALSKGLKVIATSIMARRSVHLGGTHIHRLFAMDVKDYLSPQRGSERAIMREGSCERKRITIITCIIFR